MFEKVSVLLDCPTVSSKELFAVDDYNVCKAPIMADKDILELVQSSKNIIGTDFNDKNEAPVAMSSIMRNIKNMCGYGYLDVDSNGKMNNKMDNIEQFDAKKDNAKNKYQIILQKLNEI
ncbi:hypothetical protein TNCV_2731791 [Trichonephila clavipes]|nr:hypothetical protein TNCV_2731791 [Trichonephila clavipes]